MCTQVHLPDLTTPLNEGWRGGSCRPFLPTGAHCGGSGPTLCCPSSYRSGHLWHLGQSFSMPSSQQLPQFLCLRLWFSLFFCISVCCSLPLLLTLPESLWISHLSFFRSLFVSLTLGLLSLLVSFYLCQALSVSLFSLSLFPSFSASLSLPPALPLPVFPFFSPFPLNLPVRDFRKHPT